MSSSRGHGTHSEPFADARAAAQAWCRRFGIRPTKRLSQNFLLDTRVVRAMASAAITAPGARVFEIGPGLGILTEALLNAGACVAAFELDEKLAAALITRFRANRHFRLTVGDFFRWYTANVHTLAAAPFSIASNLPYHESSRFFSTVLRGTVLPERIVLLLQREVAERAAARAGAMSVLSLVVQLYGTPRILAHVPRRAFWPMPDVDSAVLCIDGIHPPVPEAQHALRYARMAFAGRRKQIHNSLAAGLHTTSAAVTTTLRAANILPTARPQELSVDDWLRLTPLLAHAAAEKPKPALRH